MPQQTQPQDQTPNVNPPPMDASGTPPLPSAPLPNADQHPNV